ncbi:MAG: glycosyltransferase [Alphaproteobacteria bacterium]|jgi:rSAM/selenodomain-associated transferase 2|nr:glycosyltransferase [Alphaproteobacteria bacterium]
MSCASPGSGGSAAAGGAAPALSVVIPALEAAGTLPAVLRALQAGAAALDPETIVVDGGSQDGTPELAESLGARAIAAPRGRGPQLMAGAAAARGGWLLFLHADTVPEPGWAEAVARFMAEAPAGRAGYFRFALDDDGPAAKRLERMVAWRCRALGLPYGDQGLLIAREHYDRVGGFRPLALMEDVDLVRRIGRRNLRALPAAARTSARRYRRDGYLARPARNLLCLGLYFAGLPPRLIARLYG